MQPFQAHPGTVINDRYRIESYLGGGSYGTVYRVHDVTENRPAAMKVLRVPTNMTSEQRKVFVERFKREIQSLARLNHRNAVTIYDVGVISETQAAPYLVMELLDGHNLRKELEYNGPMDPRRALKLFCCALQALAEAHRLGIVHKDLKPENLQITDLDTPHEQLRIMDFGLAHIESSKRLTMQGEIMGTLEYMTPEYIHHKQVSPALDVYQMGMVLVEMFTGKGVIPQGPMAHQLAILSDGALPLPDRLIQSPIGPALLHALAIDPTQRLKDADAFLKMLADIDAQKLPKLGEDEPTTLLNTLSQPEAEPTQDPEHGDTKTYATQQRLIRMIIVLAALIIVGMILLGFLGALFWKT